MEAFQLCFCFNRVPSTFREQGLVSTRRQHEIQAHNTCQWLTIAGFPQYVQMFMDRCCPIDVEQVEKDHQFLDSSSSQLLISQIALLNHLACQKISIEFTKQEMGLGTEADDTEALSDQWTRNIETGRWVHKFLPKTEPGSNSHKLSCSSCDSVSGGSPKSPVTNRPTSVTFNNTSTPTKIRSSSLSGKDVKRPSFLFRQRSHAPLSRGSSASDSEPSSEGTQVSASWGGSERRKSRSLRNIFRRSERNRSRKAGADNTRPPSAPSSGRLDIGAPIFVSTPEIKEKMDSLQCVELGTALAKQMSADSAKSDIPLDRIGENSFGLNNNNDCEFVCDKTGRSKSVSETRLTEPNSCQRKPNNFKQCSSHCTSHERNGSIKHHSHHLTSTLEGEPSLASSSQYLRVPSQSAVVTSDKKAEQNDVDDRISIYDNLSVNFEEREMANPQHELDLILRDLYRNIDWLTETLQGVGAPAANEDSVFDEPLLSKVDENTSVSSSQKSHVSKLVVQIENGNVLESNKNSSTCRSRNCDVLSNRFNHDSNTVIPTLDSTKPELGIPVYVGPNCSSNTTDPLSSNIPESSVKAEIRKDCANGGNRMVNFTENSLRVENDEQQRLDDSLSLDDHLLTLAAESGNLSGMTVSQMALIYKLNLVKLTSILAKHDPSIPMLSCWVRSKPLCDAQVLNGIFGRSLLSNLLVTGWPLPSWILYAMQRLRKSAADAIGIFRKSGVRSRIQQLRDQIDQDLHPLDFEGLQVYDVADLLKLYFRELPDCLLTRSLSQVFISIFRHVPSDLRLDCVRAAIVLLPEDSRDVLQCLLYFLRDLSAVSNKNQMTASNLAICFAPSLFHVYEIRETVLSPAMSKHACGVGGNGACQKLAPVISEKELHEQEAAQQCLAYMISNANNLFSISADMLKQCCHLQLEHLPFVHPFDWNFRDVYLQHLNQTIADTLQDASEDFKSWSCDGRFHDIELYHKRTEHHPLWRWMCVFHIDGLPPVDVLTRIRNDHHCWEDNAGSGCVVDEVESNLDVFRYTVNFMTPQPSRAFSVLRLWNPSLPDGACIVVSTSIDHPSSRLSDAVYGSVFTSRFLIQPLDGNKNSRIIRISQIDLRGYTPDWYRSIYGQLCVRTMTKLRDSLRRSRDQLTS